MVGLTTVFALPVGAIWGGYVLERSPSFCNTCHEMQPSYEGWISSKAYRGHPDCIGCHSGEGLSGFLEAKVRGMRMIGMHYFGNPRPASEIRAKMPEAFCLKCHAGEELVGSHALFRTDGHTCADCHKHRVGWKFKGQVEVSKH